MALDRPGPAVALVELAQPRTNDQNGGKSDPGPHRTDHRGSGKVDKPAVGKQRGLIIVDRVTPGPVPENRIDQNSDQENHPEIADDAGPLGDRAGDDGRSGAAEDQLEKEERQKVRRNGAEEQEA